jgi:hypothetical protein
MRGFLEVERASIRVPSHIIAKSSCSCISDSPGTLNLWDSFILTLPVAAGPWWFATAFLVGDWLRMISTLKPSKPPSRF